MSDTIKISLELADNAASKVLGEITGKSVQAEKNLKKLGDTGSETFKEIAVNIGKSIGVFDIFAGNIAANVVTGAFNLMTQAAGNLFQTFVVDGVKAAQESENALNSLNVALAQTGIYSKEVSEEFQEFAAVIQKTSAIEDDAVVKNVALLASLTNLDKEGLQRTTRAAVNLSSALGKDLQNATEALGKAANGNYVPLNKMGIQFERAGTQAGTFENALRSIEDKFGGVATSKLNTFSGSVERSGNLFGDLKEVMGSLITENPAVINAINQVSTILVELSDNLYDNRESVKTVVAEGFVLLIDSAKYVVDSLEIIGKVGSTVFSGLDLAVKQVVPGMTQFLDISRVAVKIFGDISEVVHGASGAAKDLNTPLQDVSNSLGRIGAAAREGLEKLKTGAQETAESYKNTTTSVTTFSEAQRKAREENDRYVQSLATESQSVKAQYDSRLQELQLFYEAVQTADTEADELNYGMKLQRESEYYMAREALLAEQKGFELARIEESSVSEETKNQARLALDQKYYLEKIKLDNDYAKTKKTLTLAEKKQDEAYNQAKLQATADVFGSIGRIAALGGKKNFEIVKAFNLAEAITAGVLAVQKAAASAPPPFNIPAIVSATATSAANVAQIVATRAPAFEDGGIVPGSSFSGDKLIARVNSREMILNDSQQAQLFAMANGQSGPGGLREEVAALSQAVFELARQPLSIVIDGKEIINVTRSQLATGRSF